VTPEPGLHSNVLTTNTFIGLLPKSMQQGRSCYYCRDPQSYKSLNYGIIAVLLVVAVLGMVHGCPWQPFCKYITDLVGVRIVDDVLAALFVAA